MAELQVFGGTLPSHGCPGWSDVAYGLACRELERGDSALRTLASVQGALGMYPTHAYGNDRQKDRWLPKLARGEAVGCFGLTEPGHGSDPAGLETTAFQEGDAFVLR